MDLPHESAGRMVGQVRVREVRTTSRTNLTTEFDHNREKRNRKGKVWGSGKEAGSTRKTRLPPAPGLALALPLRLLLFCALLARGGRGPCALLLGSEQSVRISGMT